MLLYMLRNASVVGAALLFRPRLSVVEAGKLALRTRITDLDYNWHMNNARYLEAFEMGRVDMLVRSGLFPYVVRNRLMPLVATTSIRYARSLHYGERFNVHSAVIGYDNRWIFFEQKMTKGENDNILCATVLMRCCFKGKDGIVPPAALLRNIEGRDVPSPDFPPYLVKWIEAERMWMGKQ